MQKVLAIEAEKCTGCRICESWCSYLHEKELMPVRSRIHVIKWEEKGLDVPMTCQQCEIPVCLSVCPVKAVSKNPETGLVSVDDERCIGCRLCVVACPFGGCSIDPVTHKMFKCDLCGGNPECAQRCPREAIKFMPSTKVATMKMRSSATKISEILQKLSSPSPQKTS